MMSLYNTFIAFRWEKSPFGVPLGYWDENKDQAKYELLLTFCGICSVLQNIQNTPKILHLKKLLHAFFYDVQFFCKFENVKNMQ